MSRIRTLLGAALVLGLLLMPVAARADVLQQTNTLTVVPDVPSGETTEASYQLTANNGDGEAKCNATSDSPVTFTITTPPGVTAVPATLTFTACHNPDQNNDQTVIFHGESLAGDYGATWVDSGPGSYNVNPAEFTLDGIEEPPVDEDTTDPVIVANDMIVQGNTLAGANVPAYDVAVTDNEDLNPVVTFSPAPPSFFSLGGPHQVTVTATDASGNDASATFTVTVIDTIAPALSNPQSDVSVYGWNGFFQPIDNNGVVNKAKAGQSIPVKFNLSGPANVNFTPPTATDIVWGSVPVTCDHLSGSTFPQGVTSVICSATDGSNNTATNEFDVTVSDGSGSLAIMYPGYPNFAVGDVPPANTVDGLEEYAASTPGLHYDAVAKQYVYVWATSKTWAGKSGTLRVKLADGGMHTALFNFQK